MLPIINWLAVLVTNRVLINVKRMSANFIFLKQKAKMTKFWGKMTFNDDLL